MPSSPSKRAQGFLTRFGSARWRRRLAKQWKSEGYPSPAPPQVKEAVFRRYNLPGSIWVETGTWMGDTTDFLSRFAKHVWTIEPGPELAARARIRFENYANVTVVEGLSEEQLEPILSTISGDACLWLDGHFSSGDTYQGPLDTPIVLELEALSRHLSRLNRVVVLVDDIRCFDPSNPEYANYPSRSDLVAWADSHGFEWSIEHDIFVARKV